MTDSLGTGDQINRNYKHFPIILESLKKVNSLGSKIN